MPQHQQTPAKIRILFFCEAVTLAHVARPASLAQSLDEERFEVHFAHHPRYQSLLGELPVTHHEITSIEPQQFMHALAQGQPLYDRQTLSAYVEEDLRLIDSVQPDVIVGDFRISLQVSAALAQVPYLTLSNAYWSPYCRQRYVVPELPFAKLLGPTLGQKLFTLARPVAFALHCRPMNAVRRFYGLPSLGHNLSRIYTHADYTLYADAPALYDMAPLPVNHRFVGPIPWSPDTELPHWWNDLPQHRPFIYVTLGSSGQAQLLPQLIAALGRSEVTALVSTAGAEVPSQLPDNVFVSTYLPGDEAVKLASLVVCNGGSPTTQQALLAGVPVIGIASNLDQYLNMATLTRAGAGLNLRSGTCTQALLEKAIAQIMSQREFTDAAGEVALMLQTYDSEIEFRSVLEELVATGPALGRLAKTESVLKGELK